MVDILYKAVVVLALTGISVATVMVIVKWLIDMGFAWTMVAICAGVFIWRYVSVAGAN